MKDRFFSRQVIASFISVVILSLLFLAGPVQAFVLGLTVDNLTPNRGDNVTFTANINIENVDKFLPIGNLSLVITGPNPLINARICTFDINGNILSDCDGIKIFPINNNYFESYGYGYGYGYGYSYGYGYDFGYGYGYDNGYNKRSLKYRIVLDTTNYNEGVYDSFLRVKIGGENFEKNGARLTIGNSSSIIEKKQDEEIKVKTYSRYYSSFVAPPINLSNPRNENKSKGSIILGPNGDSVPKGNVSSFFSGITGAVTGALKNNGTAGAGVFVGIIFGSLIIIRYKKRKK